MIEEGIERSYFHHHKLLLKHLAFCNLNANKIFRIFHRNDWIYMDFMSQSIPTGYIPRGLARKNCPGGQDLTFVSCPGIRQGRGFCGNSESETSCPCIGFIGDKYTVSQELLKNENITLLISSSNYAKRHINVCSGGNLCSPFLDTLCEDWF